MKTVDELAEDWLTEEYGNTSNWTYAGKEMSLDAFIAGYQAGKDSASIDTNSIDTGTRMQWISVKDRLPEITEDGYSEDVLLLSEVGRMEVSNIEKVKRMVTWRGIQPVIETGNGTPIEDYTHWMPLPEAPKGEG